MGIKDIAWLFENYGLTGGIFILSTFIILLIAKSKWFGDILSKLSDKLLDIFLKKKTSELSVNVKSITESDISNHDIFNYIDFWTYSKIPTFQFSTDYRTAVFRKYLIIYLRSYKINLSKFINDKSYEKMDDAQIWKTFLDLTNRIVYDYEREMLDFGIPKIIVDKMKVKNNDTISLTIDLIEGVCNSQFYKSDNNLLKVYSILNILLSVLENTIMNSNSICDSINGQLKGLKFIDGDKIYIEP
jgi:hypothetical protein